MPFSKLNTAECRESENTLRQSIEIWQRLRHHFYRLPYNMRYHPGLEVKMVPKTALLIQLTVKDCFMEKQNISWWSLARLHEVLKHGGIFRSEMFRPNFLPLLAVVLDIFKELHKPSLTLFYNGFSSFPSSSWYTSNPQQRFRMWSGRSAMSENWKEQVGKLNEEEDQNQEISDSNKQQYEVKVIPWRSKKCSSIIF